MSVATTVKALLNNISKEKELFQHLSAQHENLQEQKELQLVNDKVQK